MAIKNNIRVWINDVEYSEYLDYPVSITDKNLEESLNLVTANLKKTPLDEPFAPIQKALIQVRANTTIVDEFKYLLLNDRYTKLGYNDLYNHSLTFIESTHILSTIPVANKTITRVTGVYEPTLNSALLRVINEATKNIDYTISISSELSTLLASIPSPEWTLTGRTLLEISRMILSLAKVVPFVEWVSDTEFEIGYRDIPKTITSKLDEYFLKEGTYDPRTYTTSLYSDVKNFLAGENKPITEPANGWLTPRSPDGAFVTADSLEFRTKFPIYKIIDTSLMKYLRVAYSYNTGDYVEVIPLDMIPQEYFIENNENFIFEKDYWQSLKNTDGYLEKGASFFYEQGTNKIKNLEYQAPTWSSLFNPAHQSWRAIVDNYYQSVSGLEITHSIKTTYASAVETAVLAYLANIHSCDPSEIYSTNFRDYPVDTNEGFDNVLLSAIGPWDLKLKIKYVPLVDSQLFSYKETRLEDRYRTYRTYNQQANVISNEVLGELHEKVLRRGNGDSMNISILHQSYYNIANSGESVGDYIISTKETDVNLYTTRTTYTLNKYFAQLKKYAAILEEYRQYAIPNENVVRSQRTIHGFAKVNTLASLPTGQVSDSEYNIDEYITTNEINLFKMNLYSIALPSVSFNLNNTLIFEAEFETNAVAGYGIEATPETTQYIQTPVKYTDGSGMIGTTATLSFGRDFETFNKTISQELPKYTGALSNTFFSDTVFLVKDAREQLAISLQLHHIVENNDIHLNDGFSRENGLIGGRGIADSDFQVAFLNMKPNDKKYLDVTDILSTEVLGWYSDPDYVSTSTKTNNSGLMATSWAIIDTTNNEVLLWVDEVVQNAASNSNLVITFHKDY